MTPAPKMRRALTPMERDDIRVQAALASDDILARAVKLHGDDPVVRATVVEGIITGATYGAWRSRGAAMSQWRFGRLMRAVMRRVLATIWERPI